MEPTVAFETLIGVNAEKKERRLSKMAKREELQSLVRELEKEEINLLTQSIMQTSAGIAANAMIGEETISRMKKSL